MPWPQTVASHYHAVLPELPDKGRKIKGLVVCYIVWLGSMKGIGLRTCARRAGQNTCFGQDGYQAQVQHDPIGT